MPGERPPRRFSLHSAPLELRMLALAIVIAVALSLLSPYFLKTNNLLNLLDQSVVTGIVSIGMTFVILTGGIDLSVGSRGRPHGCHPRPFAASLPHSDRDCARRAFGGGHRPLFGAADRHISTSPPS